jgi:hypothetical protein
LFQPAARCLGVAVFGPIESISHNFTIAGRGMFLALEAHQRRSEFAVKFAVMKKADAVWSHGLA